MHVDQVLRDVPDAERCSCREKPKRRDPTVEPSILRRLFGS
jgi:hypothetical protein